MQASSEINELAIALSAVQSTLKGAKKDSDNPFFKSRYADLGSVWEACREPLTKNGLGVTQLPGRDDYGCYVETVLMHKSGQWVSSKTYATPVKDDPQGIGSAITYARRYGLQAIVGVCPEDDDGEGAMGRTQSPPQRQHQPKQQAANDNDL